MTKEQKRLLLIDLCARLLYNVKVAIDFKSYLEWLPDDDIDSEYPYKKNLNTILRCSNKNIDDISQEPHVVYSYIGSERFSMLRGYDNREYGVPVECIKPYLRTLSSMTDEEKNELLQLMGRGTDIERVDFYISHQFDYRCLIPMGLALPATEGIYNIK